MNNVYSIYGNPKDLHREVNRVIRSGISPVLIHQNQPATTKQVNSQVRNNSPSYARQVINLGRKY